MAVPKQKLSRSRSRRRRAANFTLRAKGLVECPQCHEARLPHRACPHCGYYKNRVVIEVD